MADGGSVVEVSEYTTAIRRWWPIIAIATGVGAVLGLFVLQLQPTVYQSQAKVQVRPAVVEGDTPNLDVARQVNPVTERAIAGSQKVAARALALLQASEQTNIDDLDNPDLVTAADAITVDPDRARQAAQQVNVQVVSDSQILVITATTENREEARNRAESTAHAYLDFRYAEATNQTVAARDRLIAREAEITDSLTTLATDIAQAGDDQALIQALSYRDIAAREELAGIGAKLANLGAINIDPGEVIDDAQVPTAAAGFPFLAGPVTGGLLGALAGLGLAYLLDRRDDRVRDPGAELVGMGLPLLGSVPVGRGLFRRGSDNVIANVSDVSAEAYRRVQSSLLFSLDQSDKSVVLIAGPNNPQSTTTVAANLAVSAARAGRRTLLIGADLRRPSLHDRFGTSNDRGLSDVLTGRTQLAPSLQTIPNVPNLRLLSAGSSVDQPATLLQSEVLGRLVASVRGEFDLVVFEAPPILQVADAVDLARLCDGAVLVVEPSRATRAGVADSIEQLRRVGAEVVGTVVAESTGG